MKEYTVNLNENPSIVITEEELKEGIIIRFKGDTPEQFSYLCVYAEAKHEAEVKDTRPTIPGHPNCHYGDCYKECHVVSCGIHQGYEEIPEPPDND